MKAIALGVVAGGATVAAFLTAAAANADEGTDPGTDGGGDTATTASWSPVYQSDEAQLVQGSDSSLYWATPSSFTNGDTTLDGDTYITQSPGGFNTVFVTDDGDVYAQNQLFPGFTNLYYDAAGDDTAAVDTLKTPFGPIDLSSMASTFAPPSMDDLEAASPLEALQNAGLYSALNLGLDPDAGDVTWTPNYGDLSDAQLLADDDPYSQTWQLDNVTFTNSDGDELTGTNYVTQSMFGIDDQFVTEDGATYDQDQLGFGFTNLYHDPGTEDGDIVDMLKTPFGTFDITWMADAFTPTDFSDAVPATALDDLTDAGLYSALDLGLLTDVTP